MDREVSKQEFKELFFRYGGAHEHSGWTEDYWNNFYEHEASARYFFTQPTSPDQTRMLISSGKGTHRIFLLSEEEEESFFEFPESS